MDRSRTASLFQGWQHGEQRSRLLQVYGVKALTEASIGRGENSARFRGPTFLPKQFCETGGGAKFPGSLLLSPRPIERLHELLLGFTRCSGVAVLKQRTS